METHAPTFTNSDPPRPTGTATSGTQPSDVNLRLSILGFVIGSVLAVIAFFICRHLFCVYDILGLRPTQTPRIHPVPSAGGVQSRRGGSDESWRAVEDGHRLRQL